MKAKQRWDSYSVKALIDKDTGFLIDQPVVARIGLQVYQTPQGERREFRPASEVFNSDSMATYVGKPVTLGHVNVTSDNAKEVTVGSTTGSPFRTWDGDDYSTTLQCPLTVFDKNAITKAMVGDASEISVGYTSIDIERSGWGNNKTGEYFFDDDPEVSVKTDAMDDSGDWVKFDALQTTIRVNHIALVFRGRAGIAKLNLDCDQEFPYDAPEIIINKEDQVMTVKIKFDGVTEHEVPEAVAAHITKLTGSVTELQVKADGFEHENKDLKAKVDGIPALISAEVEKLKADSAAFSELVKLAIESGVKTDGLDAKGIKVAFVKEMTGRDISQKDDAYIDTAFDFAKEGGNMAAQRLAITDSSEKKDSASETGIKDPQARFRK